MSGRRSPRGSGAASFFLLLGCCTVLGVTFAAGVFAGRHWPGLLPSMGGASAPRVSNRPPSARSGLAASAPADRTRAPEPAPVLTFYQELTAPLTSPPPAPKRAEKTDRVEKVEKVEKVERAEKTEKSDVDAPDVTRAEPGKSDGPAERKFTVQVGAFRTREQADAVRSRLGAGGHDAYVAEVEGPAGARYRVRVGAFTTRDEARQAAQRLGAAERLSTYVTTR